jgi:hypothetical protein
MDLKEYQKAVDKVKARVARWPSAYASGQVVQEYKRAMQAKGKPAYPPAPAADAPKPLARWYAEKWIDIKTGKPCGSVKTDNYYPTCRPSKRITESTPVTANQLTSADKRKMVAQKQKKREATVHYKETQRQKPMMAKKIGYM